MQARLEIRKAEEADCAAMLELVKELAIYEKAEHQVTVSLQHFIDSGFGSKPVWFGWVAVFNNEIVGLAICYIRYSTWKGQRVYLEDFVVKEEMRGKKIGKMLFDEVLNYTKQNNYSGLVWQVLEWNEPAINFYKKYDGVVFDNEWVNGIISFENKS